MNLRTVLNLHATAAGGQTEGSDLTHPAHLVTDTPKVKDIARKRLVKINNPFVDAAYSPHSQTDSAGLVGKKYRVTDTKYGHIVSEHDSSSSANTAMLARPYSRIRTTQDRQNSPIARRAATKKAALKNPDVEE